MNWNSPPVSEQSGNNPCQCTATTYPISTQTTTPSCQWTVSPTRFYRLLAVNCSKHPRTEISAATSTELLNHPAACLPKNLPVVGLIPLLPSHRISPCPRSSACHYPPSASTSTNIITWLKQATKPRQQRGFTITYRPKQVLSTTASSVPARRNRTPAIPAQAGTTTAVVRTQRPQPLLQHLSLTPSKKHRPKPEGQPWRQTQQKVASGTVLLPSRLPPPAAVPNLWLGSARAVPQPAPNAPGIPATTVALHQAVPLHHHPPAPPLAPHPIATITPASPITAVAIATTMAGMLDSTSDTPPPPPPPPPPPQCHVRSGVLSSEVSLWT